jgi:poly-gamma-glutamate capsule biosynthesis protein CapA/YwtB (metallophosphatase superfamily)
VTLDGFTRVTFLGDTLLGGVAQPVLDIKGTGFAFDGIRPLFDGSDLVVANHEGPITPRVEPEVKHDTGRKRYWYRAAPESIETLLDVGIRVVSLANNHVLDFGAEGLADTIEALDDAGIAHTGAGGNHRLARQHAAVTVNGLRFGFFSFMQRYDLYVEEQLYAAADRPGPWRLNAKRLSTELARVEASTDVRIALAHWGRNYRRVNGRQVRLAHAVVAGGADLVIGHHPHIPQPLELIDHVPVCFSLGNGPMGSPGRFHSGRPPYGLVVSVDFDDSARARYLTVTPILVDNAIVGFQPRIADDAASHRLLLKLLTDQLDWVGTSRGGMSAELPTDRVQVDTSATIVAANASSQRSRSATSAKPSQAEIKASAAGPHTNEPSA